MSDFVLTARKVRKNYPSGDRMLEVLRGVDIDVGKGESLSVQGESGSGKSTLLNLLAGLDAPDEGEILWSGLASIDEARRAGLLGIVFQSFYLIPEIDARANVLMARRVLGPIRTEDRERADALLSRVGLSERGHHLPSQLSGGERQRIAVARALLNRPALLLADEPTGNLDEQTGETIIELLLGLCRETGTALVLVTHNAQHARRTDKSALLHGGTLIYRKE